MVVIGGVGVLDKTVAILDALVAGPLALSELSNQTGIPKPTVHRICVALEQHGLIARDSLERRRLGAKILQWAGAVLPEEDSLIQAAQPALRWLRDQTGESVQLYVIDGDNRRCLDGLESPHGLRTIVQPGALLPLEMGSAGKILRQIPTAMQKGWAQSVEEREKGVASVSAPVVKGDEVIAAISVSGPIDRLSRSPGKKYAKTVQQAAEIISSSL